jgi:hypothetical protein
LEALLRSTNPGWHDRKGKHHNGALKAPRQYCQAQPRSHRKPNAIIIKISFSMESGLGP